MELLKAEDAERKANSTALSLSLGTCIRRVRVTEGRMWRDRVHIGYADESPWMELDEETRNPRLLGANNFYEWTYLPAVQHTLKPSHPSASGGTGVAMPGSFSSTILQQPYSVVAQHLKLRMFYVYEDFSIVTHSLFDKTWPLRTLHLELMSHPPSSNNITTAPLTASILGLCAPTLESLTWIDRSSKKGYSFVTAFLDSVPCFTLLRNLILKRVSFIDSSMLDAFLQNSLCTLGIAIGSGSEYAKFLQSRGSIPALKAFDLSMFVRVLEYVSTPYLL